MAGAPPTTQLIAALLVAVVSLLGCSDRRGEAAESTPIEPTPAVEAAAEIEAPAVAERDHGAASEPAAPASPETAQATTESGTDETTPPEVSNEPTSATQEAADEQPILVAPRVDIFEVMQAGGWEREGDEDLADYLPIPPGAEGQIGRFVRDGETLSVARVTYPAEIFADPHEDWIRERMGLMPDAHERVVRSGATVLHVRAESDEAADAARDVLQRAVDAWGDDG